MKIKLLLIFTVCTLVLFTQCEKESTFVEVSTSEISEITNNSLSCGGLISNVGNVPITERGICWGTSPDLTLSDNKIVDSTKKGTYKISITDLYANTEYYIRAYAIYSNDTCYGDVKTAKTLDYTYGTVTDIDGNEYATITIGDQEWMMENLKVSKYNDNTVIPNLTDSTEWRHASTGAVCDYDNNPTNSVIHGKLYNWAAVKTEKLCPKGWHVPTIEQWDELITYFGGDTIAYGGDSIACQKLHEIGFLTDEPSGFRYNYFSTEQDVWGKNIDFSGLNSFGQFWSAKEYLCWPFLNLVFYYNDTYIYTENWEHVNAGNSVRCVKD